MSSFFGDAAKQEVEARQQHRIAHHHEGQRRPQKLDVYKRGTTCEHCSTCITRSFRSDGCYSKMLCLQCMYWTQQVSNASPISNIHRKSALLPLKDPSSRDLLYLIRKNMWKTKSSPAAKTFAWHLCSFQLCTLVTDACFVDRSDLDCQRT